MKLLGITDASTSFSYNHLLLSFIQERFGLAFDFEWLELETLPLFNQDDSRDKYPILQKLTDNILAADGLILAAEEYNHSLTPNLKSMLEWFSYQQSPFENKAVMLVGASLNEHIPQKAQEDLKEILAAPGLKAWVMSDKPFFLKTAPRAFDENGQIKDPDLIARLSNNLQHFIRFIHLTDSFKEK